MNSSWALTREKKGRQRFVSSKAPLISFTYFGCDWALQISIESHHSYQRVTRTTATFLRLLITTLLSTPMPSKARSKRAATIQKKRRRVEPESANEGYDTSAAEDGVQVLDSDNLDDDSDTITAKRGKKAVRERKKNASPTKPRKRQKKAVSDEESDLELKEGQQVVGKIVRAPKSGQGKFQMSHKRERISMFPSVPPGQISQNTFDFLGQLKKPECNDREWLVLAL